MFLKLGLPSWSRARPGRLRLRLRLRLGVARTVVRAAAETVPSPPRLQASACPTAASFAKHTALP
jgi:hypothetical protein